MPVHVIGKMRTIDAGDTLSGHLPAIPAPAMLPSCGSAFFSIACSIRATYDMPAGELQQTMHPAPQKAQHAQTHQPLNQRWCICYHDRDRQHAQMLRRSY